MSQTILLAPSPPASSPAQLPDIWVRDRSPGGGCSSLCLALPTPGLCRPESAWAWEGMRARPLWKSGPSGWHRGQLRSGQDDYIGSLVGGRFNFSLRSLFLVSWVTSTLPGLGTRPGTQQTINKCLFHE